LRGGGSDHSRLANVDANLLQAERLVIRPSSAGQWNSLTDMTDARLLAKHLLWTVRTPAAANQGFNVVNGDVFRWKWMWKRIAGWFGVDAAELDREGVSLQEQLVDAAPVWKQIAENYRWQRVT